MRISLMDAGQFSGAIFNARSMTIAQRSAPAPQNELRKRTADLHEALDAKMSRHDLSDPVGYTRFLSVMAKGFGPIEDWLGAHWQFAPQSVAFVRRLPLIQADLQALGEELPTADADFDPGDGGRSELLGLLYVLEGSRLGAKVLKTRVAPGLPTAFLGDNEPLLAWRTLLLQIDDLSNGEMDRADVAASAAFDIFLAAASASLPTIDTE